jgi:hypothetical protein
MEKRVLYKVETVIAFCGVVLYFFGGLGYLIYLMYERLNHEW